MKELGGYFELELNVNKPYHGVAVALNSARNCLKYLIKTQQIDKVYLPAYCCDSLIEPLIAEQVKYEFYTINRQLEIVNIPELLANEKIIYINYFALKSDYVSELVKKLGSNLILDNTQAFYEQPITGVDTFYSPRKFFGVADGGYLYTSSSEQLDIEKDDSSHRVSQLIGRLEKSANAFYSEYKKSEFSLMNEEIRGMSNFTSQILSSVDYEKVALIRQRNFWALHAMLLGNNEFKELSLGAAVPMVYPFLTEKSGKVKEKLRQASIYTATYWNDALNRTSDIEKNFIKNMVCLPIDQRMTISDLQRMTAVIKNGV